MDIFESVLQSDQSWEIIILYPDNITHYLDNLSGDIISQLSPNTTFGIFYRLSLLLQYEKRQISDLNKYNLYFRTDHKNVVPSKALAISDQRQILEKYLHMNAKCIIELTAIMFDFKNSIQSNIEALHHTMNIELNPIINSILIIYHQKDEIELIINFSIKVDDIFNNLADEIEDDRIVHFKVTKFILYILNDIFYSLLKLRTRIMHKIYQFIYGVSMTPEDELLTMIEYDINNRSEDYYYTFRVAERNRSSIPSVVDFLNSNPEYHPLLYALLTYWLKRADKLNQDYKKISYIMAHLSLNKGDSDKQRLEYDMNAGDYPGAKELRTRLFEELSGISIRELNFDINLDTDTIYNLSQLVKRLK